MNWKETLIGIIVAIVSALIVFEFIAVTVGKEFAIVILILAIFAFLDGLRRE